MKIHKLFGKILSAADTILDILWELFRKLFAGLFKIIAAVLTMIHGGWKFLGDIPFLHTPWRFIDRIFEFIGKVFRGLMLEQLWRFFLDTCESTADFISGSNFAKRVLFVLLLFLALLFWYPPSWWGPWYYYEEGTASWYGPNFYFNRTANGDLFLPGPFMTAAHKTLPLGITVKVKNAETGKCVLVKINDRGPFVRGRILDLSKFAAWRLGILKKGTGKIIIYTRKPYSTKQTPVYGRNSR